MGVITISRQLGSFGDEIAAAVTSRLTYDYIDKQLIGEALAGHGLKTDEIEKFDEKKPSIWQSFSYHSEKFLHLIKAVVYDFAAKENVVIVGRGGQILLKDLPGALHVRINAPFKTRMRRLMEQKGYDEKNAERIIRRSDHDSSGYIRSFFETDWDDMDLYDLVINTRTISVDTAVGLIMEAMGAPEFKESSKVAAEKLDDLTLAQKVEAALVEISGLYWSDMDVKKGIVNLVGTANSAEAVEECERIVSNIKGVKGVNSQLVVRPPTTA